MIVGALAVAAGFAVAALVATAPSASAEIGQVGDFRQAYSRLTLGGYRPWKYIAGDPSNQDGINGVCAKAYTVEGYAKTGANSGCGSGQFHARCLNAAEPVSQTYSYWGGPFGGSIFHFTEARTPADTACA